MSSYRTSSRITLHNGDQHTAVEDVDEVVRLRDEALANGSLVKLESGAIPTGQHFYLDPQVFASITRS